MLNGDDPRVWAMRAGIEAKPWVFSLDADAPGASRGDRRSAAGPSPSSTASIIVLSPDGDPDRLVSILDVPVTLSGLSHHNIANALAGAAAALGLGLPREAVIEGLRTFAPDQRAQPGPDEHLLRCPRPAVAP